jgi:hypothetical protein
MSIGTTYSFKSLTGVLANPLVGTTLLLQGGNIGVGAFHIRMSTERTVHDVGADGVVMPSYVAGDNGSVDIELQQTSSLHRALLDLYNGLLLAANANDVAAWAANMISFRLLADGSQHLITGLSFVKFPDKPYQAQGQRITWNMVAAQILNF